MPPPFYFYWLREPEAFAPMAEVRRQPAGLSRDEAVALLQLVAEEGELFRRLLTGVRKKSPGVLPGTGGHGGRDFSRPPLNPVEACVRIMLCG